METPLNPLVADIVSTLDPNLREDFEERAAIMEFEANMERAHAECLALIDLLRRHPSVLIGVTFLKIEVNGTTQHQLASDLDLAHQLIANSGGEEVAILDLANVLNLHYSGVAMFRPLNLR
ncbi:hypothetical protein [Nitrosomonas communis]|uniref:Uncharacterized protein n=1 Tax=Nitrosomonas communis TaxID=44574 RepID=A0A1I4TCS1_9PROT|nr:hypothetical protein [Nitrosomonas communis]SFM74357.1 hypothetical protein SAMN05421863_104916 [Nitrosomonas communis]